MPKRSRQDRQEDALVARVQADAERAKRRFVAWEAATAREGLLAEAALQITELSWAFEPTLRRVSEPPAHDVATGVDAPRWAALVIQLAKAWTTFYGFAGYGPVVQAGDACCDIARLAFQRALQGGTQADVERLLERSLAPLAEVRKDFGRASMCVVGLSEYFKCLGMAFSRFEGALPAGRDLDLTTRVGLQGRITSQDPAVRTMALDVEAKTLSHVTVDQELLDSYESRGMERTPANMTFELRSAARVTVIRVLADCHGRMPADRLEELADVREARKIVGRLKRIDGLEDLIHSSRQGFELRAHTRVVITPSRAAVQPAN